MRKEDAPITVEQIFDASLDIVWSAITEIDQMRQWYFENIPSFKAEIGFETQFNIENEARNFLHLWKVTEVQKGKMISYDWKYEEYPGNSFVVFELFELNNSTKLRLSHHIKESFPEDIPEFTRESGIEGWTCLINKSLKEYIEKTG